MMTIRSTTNINENIPINIYANIEHYMYYFFNYEIWIVDPL